MFDIEVVLYEPLIPQNTGNIGRLCVGFNCKLHLIGKLGFELTDNSLKRAGLDYWQYLKWEYHKQFDEFYKKQNVSNKSVFALTKKNNQQWCSSSIYNVTMTKPVVLIFGKETNGLPFEIIEKYQINLIQIPIVGSIRSYNLANCVAIAVYEASRQFHINEELKD